MSTPSFVDRISNYAGVAAAGLLVQAQQANAGRPLNSVGDDISETINSVREGAFTFLGFCIAAGLIVGVCCCLARNRRAHELRHSSGGGDIQLARVGRLHDAHSGRSSPSSHGDYDSGGS